MPTSKPAVIAVTPNPALDVTITVDELVDEATHRIDRAQRRLGGKGVNVAAVAAAQGYDALMFGPMAKTSLEAVNQWGNPLPGNALARFTPTPVPLRETWAIHRTHDDATVIINERGGQHPDGVWEAMADSLRETLANRPGSVVTISGSWPPGTGTDHLTLLVETAQQAGASGIIVDCAGDNLIEACAMGAIVKPNAAEITETTGCTDPLEGARQLVDEGARLVVCSMGPDGLVAVDGTTVITAKLPQPLKGNPTGAGDSLVAAMATALLDDLDTTDMLIRGVAWSAAAVLVPYAGAIDDSWPQLEQQVVIGPDNS
ncbi:1-phosphofructokinase family hexose kinase [Corynebacterium mendelii]|uniref:Carbohydrate kinase PfkB domain-containing protein n=1 Tax=Corynebacterium mendelii TaxID=2765362 RepID=A0A939E3C3_9CORY|nr:PfkB family carbohydrate kinase [Corynebacterium mendelii]MBN9644926.1 hypothetical protein [Corynebacterium mendelii]